MAERRSMKAVVANAPGGPEVMTIGTAEIPRPGDDELLVRVKATALNRADLMQREGKYPPPEGASPILGLEIAGTIEEAGSACGGWKLGDSVCGLLSGGGYAEYAILHCDLAVPIPPSLSFEEAAAIPEVFLTAFQALYRYGGLRSDHRVLIHAGASGVGTAAIQIVRASGAIPYVTASREKHQPCLVLGAELAVDYRTEDFATRILEATSGHGADIIVDFIGAPYFKKNVECLAVDGRIVILATLGGSRIEDFDLRTLFRKRGAIFTSTLRNRDLAYKVNLTRDFATKLLPLFEEGRLKPVIDRVMDWSDVVEAHSYMQENKNVGKIVLRVPS